MAWNLWPLLNYHKSPLVGACITVSACAAMWKSLPNLTEGGTGMSCQKSCRSGNNSGDVDVSTEELLRAEGMQLRIFLAGYVFMYVVRFLLWHWQQYFIIAPIRRQLQSSPTPPVSAGSELRGPDVLPPVIASPRVPASSHQVSGGTLSGTTSTEHSHLVTTHSLQLAHVIQRSREGTQRTSTPCQGPSSWRSVFIIKSWHSITLLTFDDWLNHSPIPSTFCSQNIQNLSLIKNSKTWPTRFQPTFFESTAMYPVYRN
jgi:hypothetical protein